MSRKRSLLPDVYKNKKRICSAPRTEGENSSWIEHDRMDTNELCDTKTALLYLKSIFPEDKFGGRLPPVVLKHQIYSILKNKTLVDKELNELRSSGQVKMFKLGADADEFCLLETNDYKAHVQQHAFDMGINGPVIEKFLSTVLSQSQELCLNKETMMGDFMFKDEEITQLVKASVLTVRDVGSWWLAIPHAGTFMKTFIRGRKAILMMIRKCKFKETLYRDLVNRKLPKVAKLGMEYHLHDIIGAELVDCVQTTSGQLLRLCES